MNTLMGDRHYYPIYAAAERHGLPIALHPNSVDGIYAKRGPRWRAACRRTTSSGTRR